MKHGILWMDVFFSWDARNLNEIEDIHLFIKHGIQSFENYKILYGGSVKSSNAADIMKLMSVDGVLIGGASLDPKELKKIMLFDY